MLKKYKIYDDADSFSKEKTNYQLNQITNRFCKRIKNPKNSWKNAEVYYDQNDQYEE